MIHILYCYIFDWLACKEVDVKASTILFEPVAAGDAARDDTHARPEVDDVMPESHRAVRAQLQRRVVDSQHEVAAREASLAVMTEQNCKDRQREDERCGNTIIVIQYNYLFIVEYSILLSISYELFFDLDKYVIRT